MTKYPFDLTDYGLKNPSFPLTVDIHKVEKFPAHRHDFLEVSLVIEGGGEETVNGRVHAMHPGTLTLVLPYQIHELRCSPGTPMRLYNIMFSAELLGGGMGLLEGLRERLLSGEDIRQSFLQLTREQADPLERIFAEMHAEYGKDGEPWKNGLLYAKLVELMVRVDRLREGAAGAGEAPGHPKADAPDRIWQVIRHMHTHYRDPLTLAGLASVFHFNASYLSEQIKKHTGKNFVGMLHEIRLRHAGSLLAGTDMTVSAVAYEVGYGSAKTLFQAFVKYRGMTPGEFRSLWKPRS
ncbi:AraC family transcriptional regulator [Gorillibacterium sp. sgz5001074]|uniref:AraC family transcriptional regulator n=1 Tax=Gorillibacterium sp. sgz5001074 TaxID=3446695 RepID=UPI003F674EE5